MLKRMQILIDTETKYLVEQKAKREGKSVSDTVRKAIRKGIKEKKQPDASEVLLNMAKHAIKGPGMDGDYDKYLYKL